MKETMWWLDWKEGSYLCFHRHCHPHCSVTTASTSPKPPVSAACTAHDSRYYRIQCCCQFTAFISNQHSFRISADFNSTERISTGSTAAEEIDLAGSCHSWKECLYSSQIQHSRYCQHHQPGNAIALSAHETRYPRNSLPTQLAVYAPRRPCTSLPTQLAAHATRHPRTSPAMSLAAHATRCPHNSLPTQLAARATQVPRCSHNPSSLLPCCPRNSS